MGREANIRSINRLSARQVASLSVPGRHADGGNLYLAVDRSGAKRWVFLYRWRPKGVSGTGRHREMGLGSVLSIDLKAARERAAEARKLLGQGIDPIAQRQSFRATPSFGDMADELVAKRASEVRSEKSVARFKRALEGYAAALRPLPVDAVTTEHVLAVLKPIWADKAETAKNVRGYVEAVLDAAGARGLRSGDNPARWRGHLETLLPKRQKLSRGHHAALKFERVPELVVRLRSASATSALALEFLILTAARSGEVVGLCWDEIDAAKKAWVVPAGRMKAGREHRVPLSLRATEILQLMRERTGGEGLVFPGANTGKPLSGMAFSMLLRRLGFEIGEVTAHGFRSSFRDWAGEATVHPRELAEAALAHIVGDETERAYRRSDALERRRGLMDEWAEFCGSAVQ